MIHFHKIVSLTSLIVKNSAFFCSRRSFFKDIAQSQHYKPIQKVQQFLNEQKVRYESGPATYRIRQCLFCNQGGFNNSKNLYTLNIDKDDGKFLCSKCQRKGSWNQLKAKILNFNQSNKSKSLFEHSPTMKNLVQSQYEHLINNMKQANFTEVLEYLKSRGFKDEVIQKYRIGAGTQTFISQLGKQIPVKVVYFPMFEKVIDASESTGPIKVQLSKIKVRGASAQNKKFTRQYPSGSTTGFFGLNTITKQDKVVVITEGQFDAMAVHQQTGLPAISLPQGANSLPDKLIPSLHQFQKIILWMDNDEAGRLGADKISYKLGSKRTYIVKHEMKNLKDANDFLKSCPQKMKQVIDSSKTTPGRSIHMYSDYVDIVKERLFNQDQLKGVEVNFLPFINKKVKGIRTQQLTIVSGPTGCGKTTFLSQLSLDLCMKQIPVLWGSFQIRNEVLISNMLNQFSGINIFRKKELFDHYADQFKNLPLHWLNFHGSNDIDKVLATIQYSIEKQNVSFVVLDTLQFMLSEQAEGIKKFDLQDKVMSRLRRIANNYNVHVVIVIHPRKTEENEDISIQSIYGTSKAAQEADNIWMIQKRDGYRLFDIKKNRFDGDVGKIAMAYDKETRRFFQLTRSEIIFLNNKQGTVSDILNKRTNTTQKNQEQGESNVQQLFTLQPPQKQSEIQDDLLSRKKYNRYRK